MVILSALTVGWARLRVHTFNRDGGCVAVQTIIFGADIARDQCRSAQGNLIPWNAVFFMEWDHVTGYDGIRRDDEAHGVTVCPWHHRGSGWRIDTKERRDVLRRMLAKLYPDHWRVPQ